MKNLVLIMLAGFLLLFFLMVYKHILRYFWPKDLCPMLGHYWETTAYNKWYISIEEKCKFCHEYRWHDMSHLKGFGEEPDWQKGKHPNHDKWD